MRCGRYKIRPVITRWHVFAAILDERVIAY